MGSPTGVFTLLTPEELATMRASALSAISGGRRTSLSGGQKSGSKDWPTDPFDILAEVKYAMQKNGSLPPPVSSTVSNYAYEAVPPVAGENVS